MWCSNCLQTDHASFHLRQPNCLVKIQYKSQRRNKNSCCHSIRIHTGRWRRQQYAGVGCAAAAVLLRAKGIGIEPASMSKLFLLERRGGASGLWSTLTPKMHHGHCKFSDASRVRRSCNQQAATRHRRRRIRRRRASRRHYSAGLSLAWLLSILEQSNAACQPVTHQLNCINIL